MYIYFITEIYKRYFKYYSDDIIETNKYSHQQRYLENGESVTLNSKFDEKNKSKRRSKCCSSSSSSSHNHHSNISKTTIKKK